MRRAGFWLIALVVLIGAAGYYFGAVKPVTNQLHFGLDFVGGVSAEFQAESTPGAPINATSMQRTLQIMRLRTNQLGVSDPVLQQAGTNRIQAQLPGVKNQEQALKYLGETALLQIKTPHGHHVLLSGSELTSAQAATVAPAPTNPSGIVINLTFNAQGTKAFAAASAKYLHQPLPIYLNNKLIEAPTIQSVIPNGQAQLSGGFANLQAAQRTANLLMSGALPVRLNVLDVRTVSATLGQKSIQDSKIAGALALALIGVFLIIWYRLAGLLADIALGVYVFLLVGAMALLGATLTLPGVAGMILSAGMAVDANVIIFSRVREEIVGGKTPRAAVEVGMRHAFRAIIDSHSTTFLAGAILFFLGSGEVKGFAITLMVGNVISLFTAVFLTRSFIRLAADAGWARVRAVFVG